MLSRSSAVGRSSKDLTSSKLECYSFLKLNRGWKEISGFIDEKGSVPMKGWRYTGKEEVQGWKEKSAARGMESRELGNNDSCKSQNAHRFYSLYALILKLWFWAADTLVVLTGLSHSKELQTSVPESRLILSTLLTGLAELANNNNLSVSLLRNKQIVNDVESSCLICESCR